jgi:hypothetical protein
MEDGVFLRREASGFVTALSVLRAQRQRVHVGGNEFSHPGAKALRAGRLANHHLTAGAFALFLSYHGGLGRLDLRRHDFNGLFQFFVGSDPLLVLLPLFRHADVGQAVRKLPQHVGLFLLRQIAQVIDAGMRARPGEFGAIEIAIQPEARTVADDVHLVAAEGLRDVRVVSPGDRDRLTIVIHDDVVDAIDDQAVMTAETQADPATTARSGCRRFNTKLGHVCVPPQMLSLGRHTAALETMRP